MGARDELHTLRLIRQPHRNRIRMARRVRHHVLGLLPRSERAKRRLVTVFLVELAGGGIPAHPAGWSSAASAISTAITSATFSGARPRPTMSKLGCCRIPDGACVRGDNFPKKSNPRLQNLPYPSRTLLAEGRHHEASYGGAGRRRDRRAGPRIRQPAPGNSGPRLERRPRAGSQPAPGRRRGSARGHNDPLPGAG